MSASREDDFALDPAMATHIDIEDPAWAEALADVEAVALRAALAALDGVQADELTLLLTDDETVRDLNRRFRSKDMATNVLSFPAVDIPGHAALGDIALAYGVCAREAAEQNKTLADHLSHLVIHGVLHLLGYDHQEDAEAEVMESLEVERLARLGVADPYGQDRDKAAAKDAGPHGAQIHGG